MKNILNFLSLKPFGKMEINMNYEINEEGDKYWCKEGQPHREDGPAIEDASGNKFWYKEGKPHRIDGPACEFINGYKSWYVEGKYHRIDGPAIEYSSGAKEYYYLGKYINCNSDEEYFKLLKLRAFW